MLIVSQQLRYWKSLGKLELTIVILTLLAGLLKLLKLLLGGG